MIKSALLAAILLAGGALNAAAQADAGAVEALVKQGREQGIAFLNTKDERAKKNAKKSLEDAEKQLKNALKQNAACEKCLELLTTAYFYQTYFGFSKSYEECLKAAAQGATQFPANTKFTYFKGLAHYNGAQYADSIKTLNRFLMMGVDAQTAAHVRQIVQDSQQKFLVSWNRHYNYYEQPEAKIMAYNPQTFKSEPIFQVTKEWELNLGSMGYTALTAQTTRFEDPEVQQYLENLVFKMTAKSPGSPFDYKITVINSPEVNALTMPGHIVVYTGLFSYADNESELAGILAHELAHNYAHHQARAVLQKYHTQNVANAIVGLINPQGSAAQIAAKLGAAITVDLFARAYSRFEEKEADLYGTHILFNAGYNPTASSGFFLKLYKANPKSPFKLLATHPPTPDRASYLTDYLESFPLERELQIDSKDFQKIKAKIASVSAPVQQKGPGRGVLPNQ
jgi:Zn-dependent protease with chaperone function